MRNSSLLMVDVSTIRPQFRNLISGGESPAAFGGSRGDWRRVPAYRSPQGSCSRARPSDQRAEVAGRRSKLRGRLHRSLHYRAMVLTNPVARLMTVTLCLGPSCAVVFHGSAALMRRFISCFSWARSSERSFGERAVNATARSMLLNRRRLKRVKGPVVRKEICTLSSDPAMDHRRGGAAASAVMIVLAVALLAACQPNPSPTPTPAPAPDRNPAPSPTPEPDRKPELPVKPQA